MYWSVPRIIDTTTIRVVTERITPRRVRKDRNLWLRRVSRAMSVGSRRATPRRGLFSTGMKLYLRLYKVEIVSSFKSDPAHWADEQVVGGSTPIDTVEPRKCGLVRNRYTSSTALSSANFS